MKKIEKLEGSYDVPQLRQKLNEIIDYLNTQPQTEEGKQPEGSFRDWCIQKAKLGRFKGMSIPEPQSTPEQKEELEFATLNDGFINSKVHRWIDDVISSYEKRGMGSSFSSDVVLERLKDFREFVFQYYSAGNGGAIIENLLSEREREAREEGFIKGVKECTEKLSKLTTK